MKNYIVWENVTIYVVWEGHETTELFECDQTNATIKLFTNIFTHTHTHTHIYHKESTVALYTEYQNRPMK